MVIVLGFLQANGFFGASGVSGAVPDAYTYIAKQFFDEVAIAHQSSRISLFEYLRPGWTVHAKGLWYYLGGHLLPVMTMIGSPNFGRNVVVNCVELNAEIFLAFVSVAFISALEAINNVT